MDLTELTTRLRHVAERGDELTWPIEALSILADAGCWAASVATNHGGSATNPDNRLRIYEAVASGHLTAALILTQHDGACELLGDCDNPALAHRLLPGCAAGRILTTVGISQLTTSRRGSGPNMRATSASDGFRLSGTMPWVTSAPQADQIVTGAVLEDDRQILLCLPTTLPGVTVNPPMQLMALSASETCEVSCDDVRVGSEHLMRGPVEKVLRLRAPVKPLTVSACGIGLAGALLDAVRDRAVSLPGAEEIVTDKIMASYTTIRRRLYDAADTLNDATAEIPSMEIRVAVNDLLGRLTLTTMTLLKGSGYRASHPIQRLVREAMFFLVWSAPPSVQMGELDRLWP